MKRRLSVLTCSRRRDYLDATLASIERAGALDFDGDRVIYVDGDPAGYEFDGWRVEGLPHGPLHKEGSNHLFDGLIGTKAALLEIMRRASVERVEMLYYTEDDIRWAKNAVPFMIGMAERMPDDLAFYTFCDIKQIALHQGITTMVGYDFGSPRPGEGGHWGNQALAVPLRSLDLIAQPNPLAWRQFLDKIGFKTDTPYASDVYIGIITATPPAPCSEYGVIYPSAAYHAGDRSIVLPGAATAGWGRQTLSYPGDDYDMMQLSWMFENPPKQRGLLPRELPDEDRIRLRFRNGQIIKRIDGLTVIAR
jgi:hypothetical protein